MADGVTATVTSGRQGIISRLTDTIWQASALVDALERPELPDDDPAAEVLGACGLAERTASGWALAPDLAAEIDARIGSVADQLRSVLGQAATIAAGGADGGWSRYDDAVLLAQGRASAPAASALTGLVKSIPELAEAFAGEGVFLDVGVGVGVIACSFCERVPGSRVIGLDVHAPALTLAREIVTAHGLTDRIELRLQSVHELQDEGIADLAHLPVPFIARALLADSLTRLHRALRPGGRLEVVGIATEGPTGAVGRWQAHNAGGSSVTEAECGELLAVAGFEPPTRLELPAGAPTVVIARRP